MKRGVDIALSTDPIKEGLQNIVDYAREMQDYAEFLHCDIMNSNFVKKTNFDYTVVSAVNSGSAIMLDCHLMVNEPAEDVIKYIEAGANVVTVHYEAFQNKEQLANTISFIKENNTLAGISLKVTTPFKEIRAYAYNCDIVLVMGVEIGASGQSTFKEAYEKVAEIDKFRRDNNLRFKIEFDGGVNETNAGLLKELGVDILVSGSYVYNSKDRSKAIEKLRQAPPITLEEFNEKNA